MLGITLLLMLVLGWVDFLSGFEIAFSVFYFLPVGGAAYFVGLRPGVAVACASTITWMLADVVGGHTYSSEWVAVWNTLARLISFLVLAGLMAALRRGYDDQTELADSDPLTGARNRRPFLEFVELEASRTRRFGRAFTVVHFDLDGFKAINDTLGHGEGDAVLRAVVKITQRDLREIDMVARLGGDEFAIMLPETDAEAARRTVSKLQQSLTGEMHAHGWPVSFSMGVLTCEAPLSSSEAVMRRVDALTYTAKTAGKGTAVFDIVTAPAARSTGAASAG
jgi:diguanylate cyclase (GGDEF)-like protein